MPPIFYQYIHLVKLFFKTAFPKRKDSKTAHNKSTGIYITSQAREHNLKVYVTIETRLGQEFLVLAKPFCRI